MIPMWLFPAIVAVLDLLAAGVYASQNQWKLAGVWFFYALASALLASLENS